VKAYRKFVAFAVVSAAASAASAQSWTSYSNERHIVGRLMGGTALRLNDVYGAGLNTPPYVLLDGQFLFLNAGDFHMGPGVGLNVGFNGSHAPGVQTALAPQWFAQWRLRPAFGLTGRLGVPIVFTRGVTEVQTVNDPRPAGSPGTEHTQVRAPVNPTTAVGAAIELGIGGVYYLTSGIGLSLEINGGLYFGDSFYLFPYVGGALGVVIDYELLP
jgi:hypothetical protein